MTIQQPVRRSSGSLFTWAMLLVVLTLCFLVLPVMAQVPTASLIGHDPAAAPIPSRALSLTVELPR